jgi:methylated-DNA-[protein]-cysteine S-methyltransferase
VKLPKDIEEGMKRYSPFSQAVWRACAEIPAGETKTYGWIARRIGKPAAARAVGRALGANPFAPLIPCHRVVASDGKLCGFSAPGGLETKRRMLDYEKRHGRPAEKMLSGRGS